jgi:uncharacterized SAM-dependent methyltransferase
MGSMPPDTAANIIDIRSDAAGIELKEEIIKGLKSEQEKTLPTLLLYDVQGLKLFERITYLDEYYLTGKEIEVLEKHAASIATVVDENSIIVELGSGYAAAYPLHGYTALMALIATCARSRSCLMHWKQHRSMSTTTPWT